MTMTPLERLLLEELPTGRFGNPEPTTPAPAKRRTTPRGKCATCHKPYALNLDGTLREHGQGCPGSHQPPAPGSGPDRAYAPSGAPGDPPTGDHPGGALYGSPAPAQAA